MDELLHELKGLSDIMRINSKEYLIIPYSQKSEIVYEYLKDKDVIINIIGEKYLLTERG